eukprot:tig00020710_g13297.t1
MARGRFPAAEKHHGAASRASSHEGTAPAQPANEDLLRELRELRGRLDRLESKPSAREGGEGAPHANPQRPPKSKDDDEAAQRQALERAKADKARREEVERLRAAQEGHYIVGLKDGATEEHAEAMSGPEGGGFAIRTDVPTTDFTVGRIIDHTFYYGLAYAPIYAARPSTPWANVGANVNVTTSSDDYQKFIPGVNPESTPWHLDRLDQTTGGMTLDGRFDRGAANGAGVDIYVIDTGVRANHPQLEGRVVPLHDVDSVNFANDCSESLHGTAVASVAAGSTVGAAPNASIFSLKVFERKERSNADSACAAATTDSLVIAGIDAAIAKIQERSATGNKAVVLIALSSTVVSSGTLLKVNPAYTDAFARLRAVDALPVTAAGNQYADACDATPGNSPGAINVGASDQDDYRAGFSNWGSCVDILAPGQNIRAAAIMPMRIDNYRQELRTYFQGNERVDLTYLWNPMEVSLAIVHGTSYAAALVAGTAALYRSANPSTTVSAVETALLGASLSAIDPVGLKGGQNRLLNTQGLNLPGAANVVGPPAYNSTLFHGATEPCSSSVKSLVGLPKDLHRHRFSPSYTMWSSSCAYVTAPLCPILDIGTAPEARSGVYLTRVRIEEERRWHHNIFNIYNYTDITQPEIFVFAGNPAMPSYQKVSYGPYEWRPSLDWSDEKGLYWVLPGTYYVLVQSAPVYRDELQLWSVGRGREGMFRLDVLDNTCPPSNPVTLQSDGTCQYADFPICGRQTLVSTPENSVGLNQSVLFAKGGFSAFVPYPGQAIRDLVLRVNVPLSGAMYIPCAFHQVQDVSTHVFILDNCPSSPQAHVLAGQQCEYYGSGVGLNGPKKLLPGTYYAVYLMRSWNSNAASRTYYNRFALSYSFGAPQEAGSYCLRGISPPASPSCNAAVGAAPLPYCGSRRSSLLGLPSVFGNAGSTAVFELTDLGFSRFAILPPPRLLEAPAILRVGTYVSICSPELDFVPTLYIYLGCPGSQGAERLYQVTGCDTSVTAFHTLPVGTPVYVVIEGVISGDRFGNFTIKVTDPDCDGSSIGAGSGSGSGSGSGGSGSGSGSGTGGSGAPQQCLPYSPPVDYYDIPCPPPMTLSRLAPVRRADAGATFCGAAVPDLKTLLLADWGADVSLWQSEAPGQGLLPAITSYPSNSAWTAAGLPTSHSGVHRLSFNVTNGSGSGPRGACDLELRVVDNDGPFARAGCPAREQELLASAGQCSVPAPNLASDVTFDASCMRPVSGTATAAQSIAPGTPLVLGDTYDVKVFSSAYPAGAACSVRLRVRRAAAPAIAPGAASPAEIAGVVGGSPAPVPVDLSYSFGDACKDHARVCRLAVRAAGDPAVGVAGSLATPDGSSIQLWNQTCAGELRRVHLSPYIRPDSTGAAGTVARTYQVALTCAYGPGLAASVSWSIPVRRP